MSNYPPTLVLNVHIAVTLMLQLMKFDSVISTRKDMNEKPHDVGNESVYF
jgi:hypothetical protein